MGLNALSLWCRFREPPWSPFLAFSSIFLRERRSTLMPARIWIVAKKLFLIFSSLFCCSVPPFLSRVRALFLWFLKLFPSRDDWKTGPKMWLASRDPGEMKEGFTWSLNRESGGMRNEIGFVPGLQMDFSSLFWCFIWRVPIFIRCLRLGRWLPLF